jgi:hypothetical protein
VDISRRTLNFGAGQNRSFDHADFMSGFPPKSEIGPSNPFAPARNRRQNLPQLPFQESGMPRRSAASLTIAAIGPRKVEPPPELGEGSIEREIINTTIAAVPAGHFATEDVPLLCAYARAASLDRRASEELQISAVAGAIPSPWLQVYSTAVRSVALLSTRLRIGPRSRSHDTRKAKARGGTPNYYETMGTR